MWGTFVVNVWRKNMRILQAEKVAGYGEIVGGRRKLMPINLISKDVSR